MGIEDTKNWANEYGIDFVEIGEECLDSWKIDAMIVNDTVNLCVGPSGFGKSLFVNMLKNHDIGEVGSGKYDVIRLDGSLVLLQHEPEPNEIKANKLYLYLKNDVINYAAIDKETGNVKKVVIPKPPESMPKMLGEMEELKKKLEEQKKKQENLKKMPEMPEMLEMLEMLEELIKLNKDKIKKCEREIEESVKKEKPAIMLYEQIVECIKKNEDLKEPHRNYIWESATKNKISYELKKEAAITSNILAEVGIDDVESKTIFPKTLQIPQRIKTTAPDEFAVSHAVSDTGGLTGETGDYKRRLKIDLSLEMLCKSKKVNAIFIFVNFTTICQRGLTSELYKLAFILNSIFKNCSSENEQLKNSVYFIFTQVGKTVEDTVKTISKEDLDLNKLTRSLKGIENKEALEEIKNYNSIVGERFKRYNKKILDKGVVDDEIYKYIYETQIVDKFIDVVGKIYGLKLATLEKGHLIDKQKAVKEITGIDTTEQKAESLNRELNGLLKILDFMMNHAKGHSCGYDIEHGYIAREFFYEAVNNTYSKTRKLTIDDFNFSKVEGERKLFSQTLKQVIKNAKTRLYQRSELKVRIVGLWNELQREERLLKEYQENKAIDSRMIGKLKKNQDKRLLNLMGPKIHLHTTTLNKTNAANNVIHLWVENDILFSLYNGTKYDPIQIINKISEPSYIETINRMKSKIRQQETDLTDTDIYKVYLVLKGIGMDIPDRTLIHINEMINEIELELEGLKNAPDSYEKVGSCDEKRYKPSGFIQSLWLSTKVFFGAKNYSEYPFKRDDPNLKYYDVEYKKNNNDTHEKLNHYTLKKEDYEEVRGKKQLVKTGERPFIFEDIQKDKGYYEGIYQSEKGENGDLKIRLKISAKEYNKDDIKIKEKILKERKKEKNIKDKELEQIKNSIEIIEKLEQQIHNSDLKLHSTIEVLADEEAYDLALMSDEEMKRGKFYVCISPNGLKYKVINPKGEEVTDEIEEKKLEELLPEKGLKFSQLIKEFQPNKLEPILLDILNITSGRGHTHGGLKTQITQLVKKEIDRIKNKIPALESDIKEKEEEFNMVSGVLLANERSIELAFDLIKLLKKFENLSEDEKKDLSEDKIKDFLIRTETYLEERRQYFSHKLFNDRPEKRSLLIEDTLQLAEPEDRLKEKGELEEQIKLLNEKIEKHLDAYRKLDKDAKFKDYQNYKHQEIYLKYELQVCENKLIQTYMATKDIALINNIDELISSIVKDDLKDLRSLSVDKYGYAVCEYYEKALDSAKIKIKNNIFTRNGWLIAAHASKRGNIELFLLSASGLVYTNTWSNELGWGKEFSLLRESQVLKTSSKISVVSNHYLTALIGINKDCVWSMMAINQEPWCEPYTISKHHLPQKYSDLTVTLRMLKHIDVFWFNQEGKISSNYWCEEEGWHGGDFTVSEQHSVDMGNSLYAIGNGDSINVIYNTAIFETQRYKLSWSKQNGWCAPLPSSVGRFSFYQSNQNQQQESHPSLKEENSDESNTVEFKH